jgi:uncharacterized RDD family membrane protein YckC
MFTIIGGDGKEYGPAAANQIREWLAAGRANLDTKAKAAGSEEWRRLGDYVEFGARESAPPPVPVSAPAPYPSGSFATPTAAHDPGALAGRGERFLAQLLDNLIGLACLLPGALMIAFAAMRAGLSLGGNFSNLATVAGFGAGMAVLGFAMTVLFIVQLWMLVTRGQTIGKRVLGVRIVSFEDGANPGFVKVFLLRVLVPALLGAVPYLGVAFSLTDYCFIFRDDRRCLHDIIAGTKVIKA